MKLNKDDIIWALSLFGTAIGAGVLFLPINAGMGGLIPLLVILVLAYPMTFLAHRGLCRFVLGSNNPRDDITFVAETYFGKGGGFLITLLYFFAILPILLVYSVNLTGTLEDFFLHQLDYGVSIERHLSAAFGINIPDRLFSSFLIVAVLVLISVSGSKVVTRVMSALVFPFIAVLVFIALLFIPHWNGALFNSFSSVGIFDDIKSKNFWMTLWLVIPVMVFSFNHSPIISSLACHCKEAYQDKAEQKSSQIISLGVIMMVVVVMFFVFSCAMTLSPEDFAKAKEANQNVLVYVSIKFPEATFLTFLSPIVALIAMSKSFLGHYLGSCEGLNGILFKASGGKIVGRTANTITGVFTFIVAWFVAYKNPSVLGIIESIGGPVLAILLFIMPAFCVYRFKMLQKYRNPPLDGFIVIMGFVAISAAMHGLLN